MIALQTLLLTYKILTSNKPAYLSNKIRFCKSDGINLRGKNYELAKVNYKLNQRREGFVNREITLYNSLDESIKRSPNLQTFKVKAKNWIKNNIQIKPK